MAKKSIWGDKILDMLKNESLNWNELFYIVKESLRSETGNIGERPDKKFNEALMKLLNKGKILTIGYDKSAAPQNRVQSFKPNGLIFTLAKTDPLDIHPLILKLSSSKVEEAKKAFEKLRSMFREKIRGYEGLQFKKWEELEANVRIRSLKEFYNELKDKITEEADEDINKFIDENYMSILNDAKVTQEIDKNTYDFISLERIEKYIERIRKSESFGEYSEHIKQLFIERIISEILNKYKNAKIMKLDKVTELPTINFQHQHYFHLTYMLSGIIDLKGNISPSDYLSLFKIEKTEKMNEDSIEPLFHSIIIELFLKKENEFLKFGLANALSDSKESLKWLEYFILEVGFKYMEREDELLSPFERPYRIRITDPWA